MTQAAPGNLPPKQQLERLVHDKINAVRRQHGLSVLSFDDELAAIARAHSRDMGRRDYFNHVSPEGSTVQTRYEAAGYRCAVPMGGFQFATGGENIFLTHRYRSFTRRPGGGQQGVGKRTIEEVAEEVVVGWMNSPGHRKNILTPFWRKEGIGASLVSDGKVLVTQNFC